MLETVLSQGGTLSSAFSPENFLKAAEDVTGQLARYLSESAVKGLDLTDSGALGSAAQVGGI
ncbi:hypothetical protein [Streptomyces sp. ODS28]|uniref:hypothetical protein n=1 Tax=Streptomyces sp. ODS28 TaxID=3136688 RepID=UPI0031EA69D1